MQLTKESLQGMISDLVKEATGKAFAAYQEQQAELARKQAAQAEIDRKHTTDIVQQNMPRSYEKRAAHIIKGDRKFGGAGLKFGRFVRCVAAARISGTDPVNVAKSWGDQWLADDFKAAQEKQLAAGTLSAGGALVPDEYSNEVIEVLRSMSVVRAAGARVVPMSSGSMTLPRQSGAGTAYYVGENANITKSEQAFDQIQLTAKKLAALTPVSNDLLRESDPAADQIVRDDLAKVMALREDLAFIRDDGTANKPKGIKNRIDSANSFDRTQASDPSTLAEITKDLFKAVRLVKGANIMLTNGAWIFTTRTAFGIRSLRDGNGNLVFDAEMAQGRLLGWPYFESNQIPENLGSGTDESEVYFGEMSEALIGEQMGLEIEVFPGGSWYDGSSVVSGIAQDQTVVRSLAKHDFALRHPKGFSVIEKIDWGV